MSVEKTPSSNGKKNMNPTSNYGHLGDHRINEIEHKQLFQQDIVIQWNAKEKHRGGKTAPDGVQAKKTDDFGRTFFFGKK